MKPTLTFPPGLILIRSHGKVIYPVEYIGVENGVCSFCNNESSCHVFNLIADPENYPEYKKSIKLYYSARTCAERIEVLGNITPIKE